MKRVQNQQGFTLIEMIGVLAVIAILVALILPKVFEVIADSKANAAVAALKTYETAVVDYYSDLGTLLPLNVGGNPATQGSGNSATATSLPARLVLDASSPLNTGANRWPSFRGPYLAKFKTTSPPGIGAAIYMPATAPVAYGTATTASNIGWDLDDDGNSDIPTNSNVVYIYMTGITETQFEKIDAIMDAGIGTSAATRQLRGRVKYNTANSRVYVYLAHG